MLLGSINISADFFLKYNVLLSISSSFYLNAEAVAS